MANVLAEPNLTAVSGEQAGFWLVVNLCLSGVTVMAILLLNTNNSGFL